MSWNARSPGFPYPRVSGKRSEGGCRNGEKSQCGGKSEDFFMQQESLGCRKYRKKPRKGEETRSERVIIKKRTGEYEKK